MSFLKSSSSEIICRSFLSLYSVLMSAGTRGRRLFSVVASQHTFSGSIRVISSRKTKMGLFFCFFVFFCIFLYKTDLLFTSAILKPIESLFCQHCPVKEVRCSYRCTYLSSYHAKTWMCPNLKRLTTWKCCCTDLLLGFVCRPACRNSCALFSFFPTLLQVLNPRTVRITCWFMHILAEMASY